MALLRTRSSLVRRAFSIALVTAVVAAALVLSGCASRVKDGKIVENFGQPDPCQLSTAQLAPNQGVDFTRDGGKIVDAFEDVKGIGKVSLDVRTGMIDVTWCNSMQDQQGVVAAMGASGLVTVVSPQHIEL